MGEAERMLVCHPQLGTVIEPAGHGKAGEAQKTRELSSYEGLSAGVTGSRLGEPIPRCSIRIQRLRLPSVGTGRQKEKKAWVG
jgi:hypothetical protein